MGFPRRQSIRGNGIGVAPVTDGRVSGLNRILHSEDFQRALPLHRHEDDHNFRLRWRGWRWRRRWGRLRFVCGIADFRHHVAVARRPGNNNRRLLRRATAGDSRWNRCRPRSPALHPLGRALRPVHILQRHADPALHLVLLRSRCCADPCCACIFVWYSCLLGCGRRCLGWLGYNLRLARGSHGTGRVPENVLIQSLALEAPDGERSRAATRARNSSTNRFR
jgi:hypothetical protein